VLQCVAACCSVLQCVAAVVVYVVSCHLVVWHDTSQLDISKRKLYMICQCVAVCCSVLQCVAVCCSVLQYVAVCCSVLQRVAVFFLIESNLLPEEHTATYCKTLQHTAKHCNTLDILKYQLYIICQCVAAKCSMLQCVAVCC